MRRRPGPTASWWPSGGTCSASGTGGTAVRTPSQEIFSVTKSLTSTLVGIAQAEGSLQVDAPASTWIPQWQGTDSADVTVRNLLSNDSGRYWTPESDYGELIRAQDRTAYAVGLGQQFEPGTVWAYNNAAIQTLDAVLHAATGEPTGDFAAERLFGPLGMAHTHYTKDGSGNSTQAFFGTQSTCPDLAIFGRLFAQHGVWNGEQLVPAEWVAEATGHPSQKLNAAYGLLWWLNRKGPLRSPLDPGDPGLPPGVDKVGRLAPGRTAGPVRGARLRWPGGAGRPDLADRGGAAGCPG